MQQGTGARNLRTRLPLRRSKPTSNPTPFYRHHFHEGPGNSWFFPCSERSLNTTAEFFASRDRARNGSPEGGASHLTLWFTDACRNSCCDPSTSNRPETPHTVVSELESEIRPVEVNPTRYVYFIWNRKMWIQHSGTASTSNRLHCQINVFDLQPVPIEGRQTSGQAGRSQGRHAYMTVLSIDE